MLKHTDDNAGSNSLLVSKRSDCPLAARAACNKSLPLAPLHEHIRRPFIRFDFEL